MVTDTLLERSACENAQNEKESRQRVVMVLEWDNRDVLVKGLHRYWKSVHGQPMMNGGLMYESGSDISVAWVNPTTHQPILIGNLNRER